MSKLLMELNKRIKKDKETLKNFRSAKIVAEDEYYKKVMSVSLDGDVSMDGFPYANYYKENIDFYSSELKFYEGLKEVVVMVMAHDEKLNRKKRLNHMQRDATKPIS